jgi:nucleoside-diphosphate-sugar epimerase
MKVFVAGATGAVGKRLVPLLVDDGHEVFGMTRSRADAVRALGATPVVADALDRDAVVDAIVMAQPDVVVHELTALSGEIDLRRFERAFAGTNRLRTEGTDNLLAGALAAGAKKLVAQSFAGWPYKREGGPIKDEDAPLDPHPPAAFRTGFDAIKHLERTVVGAEGIEGIVLRYGGFYGPGTSLARDGEDVQMLEMVRKRRFPIVDGGGGIWSFVHVDDVAAATLAAVERGRRGIYNIVDDEPAPVREWLPELARVLGAKPPRHVPKWLARPLAGEAAVVMMTEMRGASNRKAKRELGWEPRYHSWREGFATGL